MAKFRRMPLQPLVALAVAAAACAELEKRTVTRNGQTLYVNSEHAALNGGEDLTVAITRLHPK